MAVHALLHGFPANLYSSRTVSSVGSSRAEHVGKEPVTVQFGYSIQPVRSCNTRHGLGTARAELVIETAPQETGSQENAKPKAREKSRRGGGGGGRQRVKARRNPQSPKDPNEAPYKPRLEWLKQEGIDLTDECILETDELCSRSATGLLKLQRTIWRINRSISRCSSVTEALGVVEEMKAAGMNAANEGTYLALITVCRRQQQGERALSIYEAMKQAGVKPGMLTYNTLISCCQQAKRLEDAFRIKAEMEEAKMRPDVVTYTALMALVVKASPNRVVLLLHSVSCLQKMLLVPKLDSHHYIIPRLEKALQLYKEMLDRNIRPDSITFNTLMFAGAQAKLPGKVLEVYRMMIAAGVSANQFTFGILLESAGAGGRLKAALEVFNEMRAAGVPPETSTYNFLIEACAAAPHPNAEKAWSLYDEMKTVEGVEPNAQTYNHLITASCKGGDHVGALRAYQMMQDASFQKVITCSTFNKLIQSASLTEGLQSAFKMYERMQKAGFRPDVITYSTLVSACTRGNDLTRALSISREMDLTGVKANQVVQHSLIGAYGQAGQWEEAIATFRSLQQGEEPVTAVSYGIVFDACFGKGATDAILKRQKPGNLEISPGIQAAIGLYEEGVETGLFKNFGEDDLARCDVRSMSRSGTVVAILAWLLHVGEDPPASDLLVVTGVSKGPAAAKTRKGRYAKKYSIAESTLQAVGLPCKQLNTITMQALTINATDLQRWLSDSVQAEDNDGSCDEEATAEDVLTTASLEEDTLNN